MFDIQSSDMVSDTKTKLINGAKLFVDFLVSENVDKIFGYPGAAVLPIYDELGLQNKIIHYLCRHEQAAVHMAEGYARVSRKPGVVLVTSGPGATNTLTGIVNAYSDKSPIVVIAGQCEELGCNNFQEADMLSITKSCTKKNYFIHSETEIYSVLKDAFKTVQTPPMGPVLISVPKSILTKEFESEPIKKEYVPTLKVETSQTNIMRLIDSMKTAKRPAILVGGGCCDAVSQIRELVHLFNIPLVHTLMGKGIVEDLSLGMVGVNGSNLANSVIEESDLLLVLGARLDTRITGKSEKFLSDTNIININLEENTTSNVKISQEIIGDLKVILQQLIGNIKSNNIMFHIKFDWLDRIAHLKQIYSNENLSFISSSDNRLVTENVLGIIQEYTQKYNPIITTDVGQHQILSSKIFSSKTPYNFLTSGGLGAMGFGFPAAIGAYLAKPDSLVLNITGDGSFQMNMQELGTCLEYKIPIKIIIMNNSSLGLVKQAQKHYYGGRLYQSDMVNPDFVQIAAAYGIKGITIRTVEDLKNALDKYISKNMPVVFDIHTVNLEVV